MKKITITIVTLLLVGIIAGCSTPEKEETKPVEKVPDLVIEVEPETKVTDILPDPEKVLPNARLVIFNTDPDVFCQVKDFQDGDYDIYKEACKEAGFTDVQYQGASETTDMYWAYDEDHEYYLELGINHENQIIDIICSKVKSEKETEEE